MLRYHYSTSALRGSGKNVVWFPGPIEIGQHVTVDEIPYEVASVGESHADEFDAAINAVNQRMTVCLIRLAV